MKAAAALKLGRMSNLPTVWTNVMVGAALVTPDYDWRVVLAAAAAVSCLYVAGMFLNDVFDLEWDRQHQPDRPIVKGEAAFGEVVGTSIALIAAALVLILVASGGQRLLQVAIGTAGLIGLILLYDFKHKQWSFSPWLMGGCRLAVYLTAAALAGAWNGPVWAAGVCLLGYIAGITYSARAEHVNSVDNYWPVILLLLPPAFIGYLGYDDPWTWMLLAAVLIWLVRAARFLMPGPRRQVPKAVGALLAGIALIDTAILAALGQHVLALIAAGAFALCLLAQRRIAAT